MPIKYTVRISMGIGLRPLPVVQFAPGYNPVMVAGPNPTTMRIGLSFGQSWAFAATLKRHGLDLRRDRARTLQVNVGYRCDLACRHCHLEAGPRRPEMMARATMDEVIAYARRGNFQVADITGGAPELVADLDHLLRGLVRGSAGRQTVRPRRGRRHSVG